MPKNYRENPDFGFWATPRCQQRPFNPNIWDAQPHKTKRSSKGSAGNKLKDEPQIIPKRSKRERLKMKMDLLTSWFSKKARQMSLVPDERQHKKSQRHHLRFWKNRKQTEITIVSATSYSTSQATTSAHHSCFSSNDWLSSPPTFPLSQSELEDASFEDGCTVIYRPLMSSLYMELLQDKESEWNAETSDMLVHCLNHSLVECLGD
ncbi:hypothetical protein HG537_0F03760 [Torulaspora globosa]|uniref:Uncharacterized protein n=1 Tax=Torulaspora globosa TaxID=48254 RepID=A0A7H9HYH5_9SACH|nr:hypothetical protein HG537_0F03760 [Torulaspora sp. CBS 2947]